VQQQLQQQRQNRSLEERETAAVETSRGSERNGHHHTHRSHRSHHSSNHSQRSRDASVNVSQRSGNRSGNRSGGGKLREIKEVRTVVRVAHDANGNPLPRESDVVVSERRELFENGRSKQIQERILADESSKLTAEIRSTRNTRDLLERYQHFN
jgi:hypothetical protein